MSNIGNRGHDPDAEQTVKKNQRDLESGVQLECLLALLLKEAKLTNKYLMDIVGEDLR